MQKLPALKRAPVGPEDSWAHIFSTNLDQTMNGAMNDLDHFLSTELGVLELDRTTKKK